MSRANNKPLNASIPINFQRAFLPSLEEGEEVLGATIQFAPLKKS
jgi:hypothetical protein